MAGKFDSNSFLNRHGNFWWDPDLFVSMAGSLDLSLETLEIVMAATGSSGSIVCAFEELDYLSEQIPPITADLSAELESLSFVGESIIPPLSGDITATFVEPILSMFAGRGMICAFELLEISLQEDVNMATMEVFFKEPDFFSTGDSTFVSFDLEWEEFECQMYNGVSLHLDAEKMDVEMTGTVGIVASISARARPLQGSFIGGAPPALEASLEPFSIDAVGSTPIYSSMLLTSRQAVCEMLGRVSLSAILDVRANLANFVAVGSNHPVGSISLSMLSLRGVMESEQQIYAELDATVSLLRLRASMVTDGPNDLVVEFPDPEIDMGDGGSLGEAGELCDLADTLVYGG